MGVKTNNNKINSKHYQLKAYNSIKKWYKKCIISENKIKFDFNTLKYTSILTNKKVDSYLYLE